jgi:hypothetical protein
MIDEVLWDLADNATLFIEPDVATPTACATYEVDHVRVGDSLRSTSMRPSPPDRRTRGTRRAGRLRRGGGRRRRS